jgi:hypothetical protein
VASAGTILQVSSLQNQGKQALRAQQVETPDTTLDLCPGWLVLLAQQARVELQAVLGEPSHPVFRLLGRVQAAHLALPVATPAASRLDLRHLHPVESGAAKSALLVATAFNFVFPRLTHAPQLAGHFF